MALAVKFADNFDEKEPFMLYILHHPTFALGKLTRIPRETWGVVHDGTAHGEGAIKSFHS